MTLSCDYGDSDGDWWHIVPEDYATMPKFRARKRCCSCHDLIDAGATTARFECYKRAGYGSVAERIYGEGGEVPIADRWMCERCADLYFSLVELGYCYYMDEDVREMTREYAEQSAYHRSAPLSTALDGGER